MMFIFNQCHGAMVKLELYSYFIVKLHESAQMFIMFEYVREMAVNKPCMLNMYHMNISSSCFLMLP